MAILCWAAKNSLRGTVAGLLRPRLGCARFALNFFSLISEIKWNWILFTLFLYFTIKFHFSFFASFRLLRFKFSLCFTLVIFVSKWNKAKRNSSLFFCFFCFFPLFLFFFVFFAYFCFFGFFLFFSALNFLLRFDLIIFASMRNNVKQNSSLFFCFFFAFFAFFRLIFNLLRFFCLIFASFTVPSFSLQIFGVSHRSESCEIRFFLASKLNEIFASVSNFTSEARAHPSLDLLLSKLRIAHK